MIVSRCVSLADPGSQIPMTVTNSSVWVVGSELRAGDGDLLTFSPNPPWPTLGAPGAPAFWLGPLTAWPLGSVVLDAAPQAACAFERIKDPGS